jgi:hypothetical protein
MRRALNKPRPSQKELVLFVEFLSCRDARPKHSRNRKSLRAAPKNQRPRPDDPLAVLREKNQKSARLILNLRRIYSLGERPIVEMVLKHTDTGFFLPAMVAAVQAPDRSITGLHRTYLQPDGAGKAQVPSPRKMLGAICGGTVRLGAAGFELALGEGIETCLSFMQMTGIPTWAALSTSGMRSAIPPSAPAAQTIFLIVDLDPAGEDAARAAAARLSSEGRKVKVGPARRRE